MSDASDGSGALRAAVEMKLVRLGVSTVMARNAAELVPADAHGVLVYGSRARGDSVPGSDLDLLAMVPRPRKTAHRGHVSLSFYTPEQLMTGIGSLFGAHLSRDAKTLWDPSGELTEVLEGMGEVDCPRLLGRARYFSQVLGALDRDLPKYLPGLLREARYLLRSCLYAQAIRDEDPCFSVRELAVRHDDPTLAALLASRPLADATTDELYECLARLEGILGPLPINRHGSLEALIVNEWQLNDELVAMALLALGGSNVDSDYTEVSKVLL